jgi:hypothetical protein
VVTIVERPAELRAEEPVRQLLLRGLAPYRPDIAGPARRQLPQQPLGQRPRGRPGLRLERLEGDRASGTSLTGLFGVGQVIAATVIGDVRDVSRFASRDRFAAYNGTAPIEVSSDQRPDRLLAQWRLEPTRLGKQRRDVRGGIQVGNGTAGSAGSRLAGGTSADGSRVAR